ncbi:MAG: diaminopimelate decarboxylase [Clostridia bacterium]|nr:diaminopimelate decarboxylase [Clostridia bacterium]
MKLFENIKVNAKGNLEIGGCDTIELVEQYGTPLYVLDETYLRQMCRTYNDSLKQYYGDGLVLYASKAFCSVGLLKIIQQEGLGLDVVSGGEIYTAIKSGFPLEKVYFHGNNKTSDELKLAIKKGIGTIVIDSELEIHLIEKIAGSMGKKVDVLLRIKPGVEAHTHEYIQTGQDDSKFGLGINDGSALRALVLIKQSPSINFKGFHCHIGSQIFEIKPYKLAIDIVTDFILNVKNQLGLDTIELNLGGGFGIRYTEQDRPKDVPHSIKVISDTLKRKCVDKNLKMPKLVIEPGRSIVGEAGTTLYTIGTIKDIPNIRKYVSIDGGMTDNPRPALYQAKYDAIIANKATLSASEVVSIAGKCCESGDMLIRDIELPIAEPGDILAVFSTGAYTYSMASNYNRIPVPAVVLVNNGESSILVERETYEDLVSKDRVPYWLE